MMRSIWNKITTLWYKDSSSCHTDSTIHKVDQTRRTADTASAVTRKVIQCWINMVPKWWTAKVMPQLLGLNHHHVNTHTHPPHEVWKTIAYIVGKIVVRSSLIIIRLDRLYKQSCGVYEWGCPTWRRRCPCHWLFCILYGLQDNGR